MVFNLTRLLSPCRITADCLRSRTFSLNFSWMRWSNDNDKNLNFVGKLLKIPCFYVLSVGMRTITLVKKKSFWFWWNWNKIFTFHDEQPDLDANQNESSNHIKCRYSFNDTPKWHNAIFYFDDFSFFWFIKVH